MFSGIRAVNIVRLYINLTCLKLIIKRFSRYKALCQFIHISLPVFSMHDTILFYVLH